MDHLLFLAQERVEAVQVSLHGASSRLGHSFGEWSEGSRAVFHSSLVRIQNNEFGRNASEKIRNFFVLLYEVLSTVNPRQIYERVLIELTHSHLYFGGVCFIVGGTVGIAVGIKLKSSVVAPQKMRAIVANSYRGIEAISVVEDVIAPKIVEPNQVLIQVKAAGIDYMDIKISEGYGRVLRKQLNKYNPNNCGEFPVVLGRDCSGIVIAVGQAVTKVQQGNEVWLAVPLFHPGTMSEYLVVSEALVAAKPIQLTHEGAAALPYSIMIAWDALVNQGDLGPDNTKDKRVLIHAGVTGVGVVAIQLVRAWGGHVTTTVSSRAAPLAHMLGAEDVITYDNTNFDKELALREKYDVILNTVGQVLHESCLKHCAPLGRVVTTTNNVLASDSYGFILGAFYSAYIRAKYFFTKSPWLTGGGWGTMAVSGEVLQLVTPLVESGQLQAVVDKAYSAQDAEVAFAYLTKGEQIGKTVLRFRARPLASRMEGY